MNIVFDICNALASLYPEGANYIQEGADYSGLTWTDESKPKPSAAKINTEVIRLQAEYDSQKYARDRVSAYASVGDQLDMMMKDARDGTTTHQTACELVKSTYPKP